MPTTQLIAVTGFDGTNLIRPRPSTPEAGRARHSPRHKDEFKRQWAVPVVHIEKAGFQLALIQQARREGMAVKELRADRDKIARSLSFQARMEAENVWLPKHAPWLGELEQELLSLPNGRHDDQVDALSYAAIVVGRPRVKWAAY